MRWEMITPHHNHDFDYYAIHPIWFTPWVQFSGYQHRMHYIISPIELKTSLCPALYPILFPTQFHSTPKLSHQLMDEPKGSERLEGPLLFQQQYTHSYYFLRLLKYRGGTRMHWFLAAHTHTPKRKPTCGVMVHVKERVPSNPLAISPSSQDVWGLRSTNR